MNRFQASLAVRFPALASRDYSIFWVTFFMSLIGTVMQNTALPILAYHLSSSSFDLGLIGFALTLPTFFLALPGGVLVEHVDKRRALIILQAVMLFQSLTLAALTLTGLIQIWHIVLLSLLLGVATAIEITARQAMLIELVGREALTNAIALQSTAFNTARAIGPSLVAPFLLFIPRHGEGWIFLVNAISFIAIIIGLFFVRTPFKSEARPEPLHLTNEIKAGWSYIIQSPVVSSLILTAAIIGLLAFPIIQQFPAIANDILHQPGDTRLDLDARSSALYTAQGVGALIAAGYITFNSNIRRKGLLMTLGQFAYILGMIALGFPKTLAFAIGVILVMSWGSVSQLAMMNILIQLQVPNGLRGRVFSIYLWALQGIAPLGSLLVGAMAQLWGIATTSLACGVICILTTGAIHAANSDLRRLET